MNERWNMTINHELGTAFASLQNLKGCGNHRDEAGRIHRKI